MTKYRGGFSSVLYVTRFNLTKPISNLWSDVVCTVRRVLLLKSAFETSVVSRISSIGYITMGLSARFNV